MIARITVVRVIVASRPRKAERVVSERVSENLQQLSLMLIFPNLARLVENVQLGVLGGEHVVRVDAHLWRSVVRACDFRSRRRPRRRRRLRAGGFDDRNGVGQRLRLRDGDVVVVLGDHEGSWSCWGERDGGVA
jgi:hypothetical protein